MRFFTSVLIVVLLTGAVCAESGFRLKKPGRAAAAKLLGEIKFPGIDISISSGFSSEAMFLKNKSTTVWPVKKLKKSIAAGQAAPHEYKEYGDYLFSKGRDNEGLKMYRRALKEYAQLLRSTRKKAAVLMAMGDIFSSRNLLKRALYFYSRAIKLDPKNAELYDKLHDVFLSLKKLGDAYKSIYYAIRLNPREAEYYIKLQFLYLFRMMQESRKSILLQIRKKTLRKMYNTAPIDRALVFHPGSYRLIFLRHCVRVMFALYRNMHLHGADILKKMTVSSQERSVFLDSIRFFRDAYSKNKVQRSNITGMLAWTYFLLGKIDDAEKLLRDEVVRNPADHKSYDGLYIFAINIRGDYSAFRKLAFTKIAGSARVKDYLIAAKIYYKAGEFDKAKGMVQKALRLKGPDGSALLAAAAVAVRQGKYDAAAAGLKKVPAGNLEEWGMSRYWMAILGITSGNAVDARKALTALLKRIPGHKGAQKLMREWFQIQ